MEKLALRLAEVLKPEYDPYKYAEGLLNELTEGNIVEVRGFHTKTGVPATFDVGEL